LSITNASSRVREIAARWLPPLAVTVVAAAVFINGSTPRTSRNRRSLRPFPQVNRYLPGFFAR